ncbi:MAG: hypothetical protein IK100_04250 [Muribaculaceae bacterium]|nr:hypothetical protein [Muribaculaceae bacterium]
MKKYLLIFAAALLALPAFNSCDKKPTGDPTEDAEAFQSLLEKQQDITLEAQQKMADLAEYYAENEDYDAYEDLQKEFFKMAEDLQEQYEDQINDLRKKIEKVEKKLDKKKNKDSDDEEEDDSDNE